MTLRHKWPKQIGNDGLTRVTVPAFALARSESDGTGNGSVNNHGDSKGNGTAAGTGDGTTDITAAVKSLSGAVASLGEQLVRERERADHAEGQVRDAETQVRELQEKLETEMSEHRQIVMLLTEKLTARRSWWSWRRRS